MQCPVCTTSTFVPTRLEPGLAAHECLGCGGVVLDLAGYRLWRERHPEEIDSEIPLSQEPESGTPAVLCARCDRIMLRYRYTRDSSHVLDVCSHCDNVWLQKGEWAFLKGLRLHGALPRIFTDPWQRALRAERTRQVLESGWDERLGEELHQEVAEIREWIRTHPRQEAILDYLLNPDPYDL